MLQGWVVIAVALGYIGLLFLVASYGDRVRRLGRDSRARLLIYPLSLAIYCTSWTFFGSVGSASRSGYEFLTIYIGPVLMIGLFAPMIARVVRLAKAQNITSIADFIAARYGKSQAVAATVALIAIIGTVPYIALQLKAVSFSLETIIAHSTPMAELGRPLLGDMALYVALSMAVFAVLFGTRHIDATEHQDGLMLAVAAESIVKLLSFLAVGIFVTFWMFDGPIALFSKAMNSPLAASVLTREPPLDTLLAMTLLSFFAILLLPRQFHVAVVENNDEREIKRARWMFPIYLVLINLFVVPIAIAGLMTFPAGKVDGDMFVLALPLQAGSSVLTIAAFVGGLSAATAMVIVETVALAIMVSNDIVVPWVLQRREALITGREDVGSLLLTVRRLAIFAILLFAYMYYRFAGDSQLAAIGILAFAAIAQLAPAFFIGLIWRNATARGAIAGMTVGILTWAYTLLLPTFVDIAFLAAGPWGIDWLRPQHLFGIELPPLVHGVMWSLLLNILATIGFSTGRAPTAIERMQADLFVPTRLAPMTPSFRLWRSSVTVEELTSTVARYLGEERTRSSFESFAAARRISLQPDAEADFQLLRYAEHQLASAIGAASSRLVLSLLLRKRTVSTKAALKLLDDANAAIHYNREILQTALDHVRQGIAVYDKDMRLVCWNRQFGEILDLPPELTRTGVTLEEIVRHNAEQGALGPGPIDTLRARAARALRVRERALSQALRRPRTGGRGPHQPHAGRRHRHHRDRHHAERRRRRSAGARQRHAGDARARAHHRADPAQRRARPRQGRRRGGQYLQDALPCGGEPRHPAAAQRRASLRDLADGTARRRRERPPDRQCRCLARRGRGNLRRAARHLAARHRRDAAGVRQLPHRRNAAPARGRIRAAGARKGSRAAVRAVLARRPLRPPAAAAAAAEPRLQRHQIHAERPRAGRLPAPGRQPAHRRLRHRARHSSVEEAGSSSANSTASTKAPRWRAASASACRSCERIGRVLDHKIDLHLGAGARLALLGRGAAVERRAVGPGAARTRHRRPRASSSASRCCASTTSRRCWTAWRRCSAAGAARCSKRRTSRPPSTRSPTRKSRPTAFWSTTISTRATASMPSSNCAVASAPTCRRS